MQARAASLALDFLSILCLRSGEAGRRLGSRRTPGCRSQPGWPGAGDLHRAALPIPCPFWTLDHTVLQCRSRVSSAFINVRLSPLLAELCPRLHLPPPSLQGGTSPPLNHVQNPIAIAPYLLLFLKRKEEEK